MVLPTRLTLIVTSAPKEDVSGLIFQMTIFAGSKNPYQVYFPKTSAEGAAELSASDVRGQFEDHWEMGLMDYNGTIDSAEQSVRLGLFDVVMMRARRDELVVWPLFKHERVRWSSRAEMVDYFVSCRNDRFTCDYPTEPIELPADGNLHVTVKRTMTDAK